MSKKINIINNIIYMTLTIGLIFFVVLYASDKYGGTITSVALYFIIGAIVSGFLATLFHEIGHVVSGKMNRFAFVSTSIWFFRWTKIKNKIVFSFTFPLDGAGKTEMVAKDTEDLKNRFKKLTAGGFVPTVVVMLVGIIPFFVEVSSFLFCILSMFLPIGAYCLFGNCLPMSSYGIDNDGAVLWKINKNLDDGKVILSLISIQSELYNGKTPSEIDETLYFDVPQLAEDNIYFALILNARYAYYLDKGDFENAKATCERLLMLEEYVSKEYMIVFKIDALYNYCTFDFNEEKADDLLYELEKYLNRVNNATTVRVKLAYMLNVSHENIDFDLFYKKGVKEANREPLAGLKKYEKKLLEKIKRDFENKK